MGICVKINQRSRFIILSYKISCSGWVNILYVITTLRMRVSFCTVSDVVTATEVGSVAGGSNISALNSAAEAE
jgi:hypothetical protein